MMILTSYLQFLKVLGVVLSKTIAVNLCLGLLSASGAIASFQTEVLLQDSLAQGVPSGGQTQPSTPTPPVNTDGVKPSSETNPLIGLWESEDPARKISFIFGPEERFFVIYRDVDKPYARKGKYQFDPKTNPSTIVLTLDGNKEIVTILQFNEKGDIFFIRLVGIKPGEPAPTELGSNPRTFRRQDKTTELPAGIEIVNFETSPTNKPESPSEPPTNPATNKPESPSEPPTNPATNKPESPSEPPTNPATNKPESPSEPPTNPIRQ
jgi:hypothetical protein